MSRFITFTIDLGPLVGEYDAQIEYAYTPARRGRYSGAPEDCYPDEPEELEVISVAVGGSDMTSLLAFPLERDDAFRSACRDEWIDFVVAEV
jgi:hypothetical protein